MSKESALHKLLEELPEEIEIRGRRAFLIIRKWDNGWYAGYFTFPGFKCPFCGKRPRMSISGVVMPRYRDTREEVGFSGKTLLFVLSELRDWYAKIKERDP